jgi:hypothetical protein
MADQVEPDEPDETDTDVPDPPLSMATTEQIAQELNRRSQALIVLMLPLNATNMVMCLNASNRFVLIGMLEDVAYDVKSGTVQAGPKNLGN